MSEQQQSITNQPKQNKTKEKIEKQKANTNAWQKKQEEKKKKKLQEQQQLKPVEMDEKALEKAKRKQQKRLERQQMLKEQQLAKQPQLAQTKPEPVKNIESKQVKPEGKNQNKKVQEKKPEAKQGQQLVKKDSKKNAQSSAKQQQSATTRKLSTQNVVIPTKVHPKPIYTQLLTLQKHIAKSFPSVISINKPAQSRLIHKYLDQYINVNDTVLILSKTDSWHPLAQRCTKRVYLYPNHEEFSKDSSCQNITCTYEDVAYLMEGTITKIFVEMDMVFANGNGLTQKGNENIICMANEFKIPVIGFTGTWNFNAWNFLSLNMFVNKYGSDQLQNYDIIQNEQVEIIVLEIGSVIPKQISGHLENLSKIYRGCDFNSIKW